MLSGQSESDEQNGQSAIGISVRTKNAASAFSGGAMKPRIRTSWPARLFTFRENSRPSTLTLP
ncbi:hypothetical protein D3C72_2471520 [compost metagenome]